MRGIGLTAACVVLAAVAESATPIQTGEMVLAENRWTKVAEVPADPLGRELEPGRGAFLCFDPVSGALLRYGGYTPTEGNDLWAFDLVAREWDNPLKVDYSWPAPTNRPGAGAWWSTAWDPKRKVIWLFGGLGVAARKAPELFNDIWRYDPATKIFTPMRSRGFPTFSAGCRIVYDTKNDLILRAPAYDGRWAAMHNRDTTWVYDPNKNAWEGRKTPGSPKSALVAAVFVFDPSVGKAVYLAQGKDHLTETWTYDAAANIWAKIETKERPPARVVAGAAYDAVNKLVVVCGGVGHPGSGFGYLYRGGGVQLTDTWALDTARAEWKKLDVGAPVVPKLPGEHGRRFEHFCAMDYDAKNGVMVLSAPTVGVWALRLRPEGAKKLPALTLAALPPPEKVVPPKEPIFKMAPPNKRLLDLPANVWTQLEGGTAIGGGEVPLIYDEATGYVLTYGGCNNRGAGTFSSGYGNNISAYDPATERWIALRWVDPCGPPRPANACTRAYCHDPVRKVNWFVGGTTGNRLASSLPAGFTGTPDGGTWYYDGLRDRFGLAPSSGKTPSWDRVVSCYDRDKNLFVFNAAHIFDPATRTWSLGGEGLPVMDYTYGCYVDSLKGLFVVHPKPTGTETIVYDAAAKAWRNLNPGGVVLPPGTGSGPFTAYDPGNDVVLCIYMKQVYVYDVKANIWKALGNAPDVAEQMVFDTRHKVFLATGSMGKHMWAFRYAKNAPNHQPNAEKRLPGVPK